MEKIEEKIEKILEVYVRPQLRKHNGDVLLSYIKGDAAYVKLTGHCSGCPSAKYTLESLIREEVLRHTDQISDVKLQEDVSRELYDFAKAILAKKA